MLTTYDGPWKSSSKRSYHNSAIVVFTMSSKVDIDKTDTDSI